MSRFNSVKKGVFVSTTLFWVVSQPVVMAGTVSWFDDPAFPGAYPDVSELTSLSRERFSMDFKTSGLLKGDKFSYLQRKAPEIAVQDGRESEYTNQISVFGDIVSDYDKSKLVGFGTPRHDAVQYLNPDNAQRINMLGIKWQHRLNAKNSVTISTHYGDNIYLDQSLRNVSSVPVNTHTTMTSVSWTGEWANQARPSITGSFFIGDESVKDEAYSNLGRRYYGFTVGGQLILFQKHMPFVSFKLQRSDYLADEPELYVLPDKDHSRITAGWNWQVQPNWSLRAGADYTVDDFEFNLYKYDRSRIFFSTRFDFR